MSFYINYSIRLALVTLLLFAGSFFAGYFIKNYAYAVPEMPQNEKSVQQIQEAEIAEEAACECKEVRRVYYDIPLSTGRQDYVLELCEKYELPCELVFAVMAVGSNFENGKISENGDWGIMQINLINHERLKRELGVEELLSYESNVLCGVFMLSELWKSYGDISTVAMCYRYGEAGAHRMMTEGICETDYTKKINGFYESLIFHSS